MTTNQNRYLCLPFFLIEKFKMFTIEFLSEKEQICEGVHNDDKYINARNRISLP